MNDNISKKIIIIKILVVVIALIITSLSIFLIIKCNVFDFLLNEKRYVRDVGFIPPSSESTIKKVYIDEPKKEIKKEVVVKKKEEENRVDKTPWWHSFKSFISDIENNVTEFFSGIKVKDDVTIKKNVRSKDAIKIQNRFYEMHLENNKWHIICLDNNGYGYNYFFNDKGKLLVDTVTKDYKIVDKSGRELDNDLVPIKYKVATVSNAYKEDIEAETKEPAKVLYSPGAIEKQKSKLYDNTMDRNMLNYIEYSNGFKKTTNGTIYNGSKWRGVSSLKDNGSKVIFYNPNNNFNKIAGTITHQEVTNDDNSTRCTLYVYDKEHDNVNIDDYLYMCDSFNYNEPIRFSFTFYRSVKNIEFLIVTDGDSKKRICYLKNLKFGFDKNAYKDELEEKQDDRFYMNLLKELGIYHEIYEIEEEELDDEYDYYIDDYEFIDYEDADLIDKDYRTKEEIARDRVTGPTFDPELKNKKQVWDIGPAFDENFK